MANIKMGKAKIGSTLPVNAYGNVGGSKASLKDPMNFDLKKIYAANKQSKANMKSAFAAQKRSKLKQSLKKKGLQTNYSK